ncbi:MAG: hypothetical protein OQJ97_04650 [Rhodospirillales bacterium]|nr:hypothetical protein [Rhodospirillales bacterium]
MLTLLPNIFWCLLLLFALFLPLSGQAQTVPSGTRPGQIERQFEEFKEPRATPKVVVPETIQRAKPPANAKSVKFVLLDLNVVGATVFTKDQLSPLYKKYLGQEISLLTIYEIADALTTKYRNSGYILSRALLPRQTIASGVVRIQVVEGFVDEVIFSGDAPDKRGLLKSIGQKIVKSRPLNVSKLERYLLLMRDVPGYEVSSVLVPGKVTGASTLTVKLKHQVVNAGVSVDNRGSHYVGPIFVNTRLSANSLAGLGERTQIRYITTDFASPPERDELQFFDISHQQKLNAEGTSLSLRASRTTSTPGGTLEDDQIESKSRSVSLGIRHPFLRSRAQNLSGYLTFDYLDSDVNTGGEALSRDRVRAARTGVAYDFIDKWRGISAVELGIGQGLPILNNSPKNGELLSNDRGRSDFTKFEINASRKQSISENFNILGAVSSQYSFHRLLSSEEFGVGGSSFGRGFDPSEISGESGVAAKLELQYSNEIKVLPFRSEYQMYLFYDAGSIWAREDSPSRDSISSTGLGVRFNLTDYISGSLEYAQPLVGRTESRGKDGQAGQTYFGLAVRY